VARTLTAMMLLVHMVAVLNAMFLLTFTFMRFVLPAFTFVAGLFMFAFLLMLIML
jgi:hypothetical protein